MALKLAENPIPQDRKAVLEKLRAEFDGGPKSTDCQDLALLCKE